MKRLYWSVVVVVVTMLCIAIPIMLIDKQPLSLVFTQLEHASSAATVTTSISLFCIGLIFSLFQMKRWLLTGVLIIMSYSLAGTINIATTGGSNIWFLAVIIYAFMGVPGLIGVFLGHFILLKKK
jgi:hypothetical protein